MFLIGKPILWIDNKEHKSKDSREPTYSTEGLACKQETFSISYIKKGT